MEIRSGKRRSGWNGMIYGKSKVGKSTFASHAPRPLFADVEDGLRHLDVQSIECGSWPRFLEICRFFSNSEFQTLVVDGTDLLEKHLWAFLCSENKWKTISSPGYGVGYEAANQAFLKVLLGLRAIATKKNKNILWVCHSDVKTVMSPDCDHYEMHKPRLQNKVSEIFLAQTDFFGLCHDSISVVTHKENSRAYSSGDKVITIGNSISCECGNRFGLSGQLPLVPETYNLFVNQ